MFTANCLSIEQIHKELATCFDQPKGGKCTFPMFDNELLSLSRKKLELKIVFF